LAKCPCCPFLTTIYFILWSPLYEWVITLWCTDPDISRLPHGWYLGTGLWLLHEIE
jgi:hypothetical protein